MKKNQKRRRRAQKKKRPAFYFSQVSGIAPRPAYAKKKTFYYCAKTMRRARVVRRSSIKKKLRESGAHIDTDVHTCALFSALSALSTLMPKWVKNAIDIIRQSRSVYVSGRRRRRKRNKRDLATGKDLSIPEDFSLTLLYPNFLLQHTRRGRRDGIRKWKSIFALKNLHICMQSFAIVHLDK